LTQRKPGAVPRSDSEACFEGATDGHCGPTARDPHARGIDATRQALSVLILFGVLLDLTGVRSSAFMLLYGVVWVSLVWMYFTEVRRTHVTGRLALAGTPS
jgi:hypothetical protein